MLIQEQRSGPDTFFRAVPLAAPTVTRENACAIRRDDEPATTGGALLMIYHYQGYFRRARRSCERRAAGRASARTIP
jgi:hypothetical protein